ncbi:MAG: helix-turn-helix transcriptional regulator [Thermoplasmata archaeon]
MTLEIIGDRKILSELGNRKRIEILKYLHDNGWCYSAKVAGAVKLHTAIVSNFLDICSEYGIVEKRFVRGKRRGFYEYKLKAPEFWIKVKVVQEANEQKIMFLREVLAYCERVFGRARTEAIKSRLGEKIRYWIDNGEGKIVSVSEIEYAEKQIFEELANLAGVENAKKILEKTKEEIKNEENKVRNKRI